MPLKKKLRRFERRVLRPVVKGVDRNAHRIGRLVRKGILPAVVGAGRKRVRTNHVQADFQQESIQLIVTTGGEVNIQEVASPCPGGDHNIVPCEQPLEIELNGGGFVFNDKFCTKCGEHFPFEE